MFIHVYVCFITIFPYCTLNVYFISADCGVPPELVHGSYQGALTTTFNAVVTAFCDTGYNLVGNNKLTCQDHGTWSPIQATCVPVGTPLHVQDNMYCEKCGVVVKIVLNYMFET